MRTPSRAPTPDSLLALLPPPQSGPQTEFDACEADITIFGGSAGGGKTWALLRDAVKHAGTPGYGFVLFRRTSPQIVNEGGLWDASLRLYPALGGDGTRGNTTWRFPSGAKGAFRHLQHEDTVLDWQGAEVPYLGFDELTHFTARQFFYMLSRNRSTCGVRPRVRATCNPAPGWVRELLAPWVVPNHPDPAASGEIRWFTRVEGQIVWVGPDWRDEDGQPAKSLTFIRSSIYDNAKLLAVNPQYLANLRALPEVERRRLLEGDWNVFDGAYFAEWTEALHTCLPPHQPGSLPHWWRFFGGLDWGYNPSPFAFVLCASDERGHVHVIESIQALKLNDDAQAERVAGLLAKWGVPRDRCPIAFDPAMQARQRANRDPRFLGESHIEAYYRAGLQCVPADNDRLAGWSHLRRFLTNTPGGSEATGQSERRPVLQVWQGFNADLIAAFPLAQYATPRKGTAAINLEDMDTDGDDHLLDALRYALRTRPVAAETPPAPDANRDTARALLAMDDAALRLRGFDRDTLREMAGEQVSRRSIG